MFLVSVRLLCWLPPARTSQQLCLRAIPRTLAANKSAAAVDLLLQYPSAAVDLLLQQPYCCSRRIAAVTLLCSKPIAAVKTAAFEYKYCFAAGKTCCCSKASCCSKACFFRKTCCCSEACFCSNTFFCSILLLQLPTAAATHLLRPPKLFRCSSSPAGRSNHVVPLLVLAPRDDADTSRECHQEVLQLRRRAHQA